jgi:hypothetical protein
MRRTIPVALISVKLLCRTKWTAFSLWKAVHFIQKRGLEDFAGKGDVPSGGEHEKRFEHAACRGEINKNVI